MNETKLHILKIAFKLFLQKNFKEVTMQDLMKEAGLSKGAFYHYFESKEQVFLEVVKLFYLSEELNDYSNLDKNSLEKFYLGYLEHINSFIKFLKDTVELDENTPSNINYFTLIFDATTRFPHIKERVREIHAIELEMWKLVVENAQKNQEINYTWNSLYIAKMFIRTIDSTFIHAILVNDLISAFKEIRFLWDNFYQSIKK